MVWAAAGLVGAMAVPLPLGERASARPDPAPLQELLDGVEVSVPRGLTPRTPPRKVALRILGRQVPGAGLTSLALYRDGPDLCHDKPQYGCTPPRGGPIWFVRAHDVHSCFHGVSNGCRVVPTAYYLVSDRDASVFGFGVP